MNLCFPLNRTHLVTIISAHAPTCTCPDEAKQQFYEDLDHLIKATVPNYKLIILGDFNARISKVSNDWKGVLGSHGMEYLNTNGLFLLSKCSKYRQCINTTIFHQADKYKATWMHPRSKQWHPNDFAIVKHRDIRDVRITHAMHGAKCWTDHRSVRSILQLHIAPTQCKHPKVIRSPFNMARLRPPTTTTGFGKHLMRSSRPVHPMLKTALRSGASLRRSSLKL